MADRIIATGGQLDLNALRQASRDGGYVYDDGAGNLRVSQRRMRGGFLWLGTDSRHKQGFQQLQALVKQQ